jgi:ketosteroid isomerase-like protein
MDTTQDFDSVIEQYHQAAAEFVKGNPAPYVTLWSQQDDVSIANPWGPPIRGWTNVRPTVERAATNWHDGEVVGFENISKILTPELAYIVEIERFTAKMGDSQEMVPVALRTTSVLRPEDGTWKLIHRHADSITTARTGDSVIQK